MTNEDTNGRGTVMERKIDIIHDFEIWNRVHNHAILPEKLTSWGRLGGVLERLGGFLGCFEATLLASKNFLEACHLGSQFSKGF